MPLAPDWHKGKSLDEQERILQFYDPANAAWDGRRPMVTPAEFNAEFRRIQKEKRKAERCLASYRIACNCSICQDKKLYPNNYVGSAGISYECFLEGQIVDSELAESSNELRDERERVGSVIVAR